MNSLHPLLVCPAPMPPHGANTRPPHPANPSRPSSARVQAKSTPLAIHATPRPPAIRPHPATTLLTITLLALTLCTGPATAQQPPPSPHPTTTPTSANATDEALPEDTDVIFLKDGSTRAGRIQGLDGDVLRIQRQVLPGQPTATITIPRAQVERIEFAHDPEREALITQETFDDLLLAARYWGAAERFLEIPRSPAARIGLRYAALLLKSGNPATRERALQLFRDIEARAWSPEDKAEARRGRLRALIATGRAQEAIAEAEELANTAEDPAVLIEAKYILATAASTQLRTLEDANPRWQEDRFIRPERHRLYNEALDLYLFPCLFFGSMAEPSARGLWAATEIYHTAGEFQNAAETARDLIAFYPESPEAAKAKELLQSLPQDIQNHDQEHEARLRLAK